MLRWFALPVLLAGIYLLSLQVTGNFHEVVAGELYRSGQLSGQGFALYTRKYNIRSVINLRGANEGEDWYDTEYQAAKASGLTYVNFRMSSKRELTQADTQALIEQMRNAPKPLLIHCRAGADRTGLAAALYLAALEKQPESTAERQLSAYYGHIGAAAMDRSFEAVEAYLGYPRS